MQEKDVLDLDVLRPSPVVVKLAGKKIDVSFIPVGITFAVDEIVNKIALMNAEELAKGGAGAEEAITLTIRLCALFCSVRYPEMDEAWFRENTNPAQMVALADKIKTTLQDSYEKIEAYQKN